MSKLKSPNYIKPSNYMKDELNEKCLSILKCLSMLEHRTTGKIVEISKKKKISFKLTNLNHYLHRLSSYGYVKLINKQHKNFWIKIKKIKKKKKKNIRKIREI
jgi:hypothetical protein